MRAAGHDPLPDPGELHRPAGVHAVAAGAVLAGHLPHARVHAQPAQRPREPLGRALEALVDAGARLGVGHGVADLHRPVVEDRRAPAGEPQRGLEAVRRAPRAPPRRSRP